MNVSQQLKSRAEAFRKELLLGLSRAEDVIAWADGIVASEDAPHISFIELSMAPQQALWAITDLLKAIPGEPSEQVVRSLVFCRLRDVLRDRPHGIFGSATRSAAYPDRFPKQVWLPLSWASPRGPQAGPQTPARAHAEAFLGSRVRLGAYGHHHPPKP